MKYPAHLECQKQEHSITIGAPLSFIILSELEPNEILRRLAKTCHHYSVSLH